jgi:predicted transcriptional regulator
MKKIISLLLLLISFASFALAADSFQPGKILKWENGTYAEKNKSKSWIVYQLQAGATTYSIARHKETKPQMQAGEAVQYEMKKKNEVNLIDVNGKKRTYQIVGQTAAQ